MMQINNEGPYAMNKQLMLLLSEQTIETLSGKALKLISFKETMKAHII